MNDLIGQKFHKLTVVARATSNRSGSSTWLCKCDCGNEKVYSSDHLTRKKHSVKSCGCQRTWKGANHKQWSGVGDMSGDWWYSHVLRERKQKRRTPIPVTVTKEDAWELFLKQDRKCALSGVSIEISGNHRTNTASIDRIDSSKGYELDNIQWVHKHVNFMKRTYSQEYFIQMCKNITEHSKKCNFDTSDILS